MAMKRHHVRAQWEYLRRSKQAKSLTPIWYRRPVGIRPPGLIAAEPCHHRYRLDHPVYQLARFATLTPEGMRRGQRRVRQVLALLRTVSTAATTFYGEIATSWARQERERPKVIATATKSSTSTRSNSSVQQHQRSWTTSTIKIGPCPAEEAAFTCLLVVGAFVCNVGLG